MDDDQLVWRAATLTAVDAAGDGRTLTVRLLPWDVPTTVDDGHGPYTEQVARGALVAREGRTIPVYAGHDPLTRERGPMVGRVDQLADRDDGLYGTLRLADTAAGRDQLALLADQVTTGVSVEFPVPGPGRAGTEVRRTGPHPLTGVALVANPAYDNARVLAARSEGTPMTMTDVPPTQPDPQPDDDDHELPPIQGGDDDDGGEAAEQARRAAAIAGRTGAVVPAAAPPPGARYRSYGEFVRGTVEKAMRGEPDPYRDNVYRALVDEITDDVPGLIREGWVTEVKGLLDLARPTVTAFNQVALPKGDPIVWAEVTALPPVGPQTAEKAEVVSGKLTVVRRTTDIVTYGGAQDVSIQVITRSQPSYIDMLMRAYAMQMSRQVNAGALAAVETGITTTAVDLGADPAVWAAKLAEAEATILANVYVPPDVLVIGTGIRTAWLSAVDSEGRPLFTSSSPSNPLGSLELGQLTGGVRGIRVVTDPGLDPYEGYLGWSGAFQSMLSPVGNLQVDNPGQLGRDIAVYQMAAFALFYPKGIVKLTMPVPVPDARGSKK